uniref:Uncharacterized protein n=1 Tax=Knipowitschia caucasica TaxID=637954 RepID=A0AAV2KML6_KNICA
MLLHTGKKVGNYCTNNHENTTRAANRASAGEGARLETRPRGSSAKPGHLQFLLLKSSCGFSFGTWRGAVALLTDILLGGINAGCCV